MFSIGGSVALVSVALRITLGAGYWPVELIVPVLLEFLILWPNQRRQVLGLKRKPSTPAKMRPPTSAGR